MFYQSATVALGMIDHAETVARQGGIAAYDPATSDGCSVPKALRLVIPKETPEQIAVCVSHDEAYYYGGARRDRAVADAFLLIGLLACGMDVDEAHRYHAAVRMFGKPHWKGQRYTDE